MAQLFPRHSGLYLSLAALALAGLVLAAASAWHALTAPRPRAGESAAQPIAFSHAHHVGELGLDCRGCHGAVEDEPFAGIPSLSTCMSCHSHLFTDQPELAPLIRAWSRGEPLRWQRVHALPDFVKFDHASHVRGGVACESCHGRVDRMQLTERVAPLTMGWCLDCHRDPAPHLRAQDQVFTMGGRDDPDLGGDLLRRRRIDVGRLLECSTCHR